MDIKEKEALLLKFCPFAVSLSHQVFEYHRRQEVIHEILFRAWEELLEFQEDDIRKAAGFIKRKMLCTWLDERKRLTRQQDNDWNYLWPTTENVLKRTYGEGFQEDFIRDVHETVQSLPDSKDREICEMIMAGYSQKEIAPKIGTNQSSISRRLKNLKKYFLLFA